MDKKLRVERDHQSDTLEFLDAKCLCSCSYQLKKKLDDKGKRCIFIGYNTNSKTYKLYNPKTKKVLVDMTSNEKDMWNWSLKSQKGKMVIPNNCEKNERQVNPTPNEHSHLIGHRGIINY
ncbi:hypothetical protein CR513_08835, partial [Mucuna pruriens]